MEATRDIATLELGAPGYSWRVVSHCGVVKVFSSRDGCMFAMNPDRARALAVAFTEAMVEAAAVTDERSYGVRR